MSTKMKEPADKISDAVAELVLRQQEYDDAKSRERAASMASTNAVNALNKQQKVVDALMADIRLHGAGDWASNRRTGRGCLHNAVEHDRMIQGETE